MAKHMRELLYDPELGAVSFAVKREVRNRSKAETALVSRSMSYVTGIIHPAAPEEIRAGPAEDVHEEYVTVYTDYMLSQGENFGRSYTLADQIIWQGKTYRVVSLKTWPQFRCCKALAVLVPDTELTEQNNGG